MAKKSKETKLPKDGRYIVLRDNGMGVIEPFNFDRTASNGIYIYDGTEQLEDAICAAYEEIGGVLEEWEYTCPIGIFSLEDKPEYIESTIRRYRSDIEKKEKTELARLKKKYEKDGTQKKKK